MKLEGRVQAIDAKKRSLIVRHRLMDKSFEIAADCEVRLHDESAGTLASVQPGEWVTIIYEAPAGIAMAREIEQTSETFTCTLTAIDLSERMVKAKGTFGTKKFILADGCSIVIGKNLYGQLQNLNHASRAARPKTLWPVPSRVWRGSSSSPSRRLPPRRPSCSWARAAPARRCWPAPFMTAALKRTIPSSPPIAPAFRGSCCRASCSAT